MSYEDDIQETIQKIIRTNPHLTESELRQELENIQNPLIPEEECNSQMIPSVENSGKLKSFLFKLSSKSGLSDNFIRSGGSLCYSAEQIENPMEEEENSDDENQELKYQEDSLDLSPPPVLINSQNDNDLEDLEAKIIHLESELQLERSQKDKLLTIFDQQKKVIEDFSQKIKQLTHQNQVLIEDNKKLQQKLNSMGNEQKQNQIQIQNQSQEIQKLVQENYNLKIVYEKNLVFNQSIINDLQKDLQRNQFHTPIKKQNSYDNYALEDQKTQRKSSHHEMIKELQDKISKLSSKNKQIIQGPDSKNQGFEQRLKYISAQNIQVKKVQGFAFEKNQFCNNPSAPTTAKGNSRKIIC